MRKKTFKVPTDFEYEYSEKDLLKNANPGFFAFGVRLPMEYYYSENNYAFNYNYFTDYQNFRWKSIDESLGLVNKKAENFYYNYYYKAPQYYYYNYYTYKAD